MKRRDRLNIWLAGRIPKMVLVWALIRATSEYPLQHAWEDRSNVAFWRVLDWHVWNTLGNGSFDEWSRSGGVGLSEIAASGTRRSVVDPKYQTDGWGNSGGS